MSKNPKISLIAAISKNRVIGRNNDLIWRIPEDLRRFRSLTEHHAVIMGRKTFQSIGQALPNRTNIVVSREPGFLAEGCLVAGTLDFAIQLAKERSYAEREAVDEIFIIGGGQLFEQAVHLAHKLYLTVIDREAEGDVLFPEYSDFQEVSRSQQKMFQGLSYHHVDYERRE